MSDFFTRLAERILGLAPVVQPDLMPLLPRLAESEAASDALPGLEHTRDGATVAASKAAPPQQADWLSRNIVTTELAARAENVPQSSTQDWQQRRRLETACRGLKVPSWRLVGWMWAVTLHLDQPVSALIRQAVSSPDHARDQ